MSSQPVVVTVKLTSESLPSKMLHSVVTEVSILQEGWQSCGSKPQDFVDSWLSNVALAPCHLASALNELQHTSMATAEVHRCACASSMRDSAPCRRWLQAQESR